MWSQIRLLLQKQSDLVYTACLGGFKTFSADIKSKRQKQITFVVIGTLGHDVGCEWRL